MKMILLYVMSVAYIAAGLMHFLKPKGFVKIMPPFIPLRMHLPLVYFTGAWEIIAGIFLLPAETRSLAAWSIILLLILVFPANVQMMLIYQRKKHPLLWLMVLRLPLQIALIWWAWLYT